MKMNYGSHFRFVRLGSHQIVIDGEHVFCRKFVRPIDKDFLAFSHFDCRTRHAAAVSPHVRIRQVAMNLD